LRIEYGKEIQGLRNQLAESNKIVEEETRNRQIMQDNLKKAFMRGVCALNFEAMNVLNPNSTSSSEGNSSPLNKSN
jgi:hypothetical protein